LTSVDLARGILWIVIVDSYCLKLQGIRR